MSSEYPERFPARVNPWRMAEGHQSLAGSIPLCELSRLREFLHQDDQASVTEWENSEPVRFTADFGRGENRRSVIRLHILAALPLLCQRSLEVYQEKMDFNISLTLVDANFEQHQGKANELEDGTDSVLVDSKQMAIANVVEEELIIRLPLIATNPDCPLVEYHSEDKDFDKNSEEHEKRHPFADLKNLR